MLAIKPAYLLIQQQSIAEVLCVWFRWTYPWCYWAVHNSGPRQQSFVHMAK